MITDTLEPSAPTPVAEPTSAVSDPAIEGLYLYPDASEPVQRYRWQILQDGRWGAAGSGDVDQLRQAVTDWPAQVVMVLPAEVVVTRSVSVAASERRYFKKLAPYQLEEDIIDDVESMHFVFGPVHDEQVELAYLNRAQLAGWLAPLQKWELPVSHIVSAATLMPWKGAHHWSFYQDDQQLCYRMGQHLYGAIRPSLAPLFLKSLVARTQKPVAIDVLARTPEQLAALVQWLPDSLQPLVDSQSVNPEALPAQRLSMVNLAVDQFFPRIPLMRWWSLIRAPLLLVSIGLIAHLIVALVEWQMAVSHTATLQAAITSRYRAAVPVGAISDPLKQLQNQVNRLGNSSATSNALFMLSNTVPILTAKEGVEVKNLQFINATQELRLTVQAPALADIESLSSQFKAKGFSAEVLSVNVNQGVHQARMKVTRP